MATAVPVGGKKEWATRVIAGGAAGGASTGSRLELFCSLHFAAVAQDYSPTLRHRREYRGARAGRRGRGR